MIPILADVLPIDIKSYIQDGPTALLIIALIFAVMAVSRGWVVPKSFYDREVKRGDDATAALHKNNELIESLTREIRDDGRTNHE